MENYGEKAVFVHVYGPEPHPAAPDLNFDAGTLLSNYWSVWRQSVTYEDRVEKAKTIRSITHPDQVKNGLLCMHTCDGSFFWLSAIQRAHLLSQVVHKRPCVLSCIRWSNKTNVAGS